MVAKSSKMLTKTQQLSQLAPPEGSNQRSETRGVASHSPLAAEPEDTADVHGLPAEVPAVQTDSHGSVAELAQRQRHRAEVQQPAAKHTQKHVQVQTNERRFREILVR